MNDTRFPVSIHDFVTKDKFAADWLVRVNPNTRMWFPKNVVCEVDGLVLPNLSFLGRLMQSVWLAGDVPVPANNKAILFRQLGYPIQVDTSITGTDVETWFSLIKSPVNFAIMGDNGLIQCRIWVEEVTPLQFSEAVENWIEVYEKENKNAKDQKSS